MPWLAVTQEAGRLLTGIPINIGYGHSITGFCKMECHCPADSLPTTAYRSNFHVLLSFYSCSTSNL
jgi:hypothetical protein